MSEQIDGRVLGELAEQLTHPGAGFPPEWPTLFDPFRGWAEQPGLRHRLRRHIEDLSADSAARISGRSRETTTHFAWCLRDRAHEPFSFWLHEYKPQRDWRHGYADSVHNHRYHFCTTLIRGEYLHERHQVVADPATGLVVATHLLRSSTCVAGDSGYLQTSDFHRIPQAADGTMTFLVKSREITPWSLSYDPTTGTGHRHVPVEARLAALASSM
jgi:hypothetical protein